MSVEMEFNLRVAPREMNVMRRVLVTAAVVVALLAATGRACSIPVFRYALERWQPDLYEVLVFHRGGLTTEQQALVDRFAPEREPGDPLPNTSVVKVDLDGQVRPEFAALWKAEPGQSLPWVMVRTPWRGENESVWAGELTSENLDQVLMSPHRAELAKRLLEGDSVVFVFLNGSDKERDDKLFTLAKEQFERLQKEITLPRIEAEDLQSLSVTPDKLGLKFSMLRLDRVDPREQVMIQAMLSLDPQLREERVAREPLLFPVFGRGRVFFPLVGDDIAVQNIEDLAKFLCGACQCTVKQQNPGVDLLTTIDWQEYILPTFEDKPLPPLTGLAGFAASEGGESSPPMSKAALPMTATPVAEQAVTSPFPPIGREEAATSPSESMSGDTSASALSRESPAPAPHEGVSLGMLTLGIAGGLTLLVLAAGLYFRPRS
jgi:hypothetical protein